MNERMQLNGLSCERLAAWVRHQILCAKHAAMSWLAVVPTWAPFSTALQ